MEAQEFIELLEKPEKAKEKGIDELKRLAQDFPYSQSMQLLYAIRLRKSSEHLFNQQLGRASILTNDRSVLFDLFEQGGLSPLTEHEEEQIEFPKPEVQPRRDSSENQDFENWQQEKDSEAEEGAAQPEKEAKPFAIEPDEEKHISESAEAAPAPAPLKVHNHTEEEAGDDDEDKKHEAEAESESKGEEKAEEKPREKHEERDLSSLPAGDRIKAILEKNRKLREDFEAKKQQGEAVQTEMDERLQKIRERLSDLKRPLQEKADSEKAEENKPTLDTVEETNDLASSVAETDSEETKPGDEATSVANDVEQGEVDEKTEAEDGVKESFAFEIEEERAAQETEPVPVEVQTVEETESTQAAAEETEGEKEEQSQLEKDLLALEGEVLVQQHEAEETEVNPVELAEEDAYAHEKESVETDTSDLHELLSAREKESFADKQENEDAGQLEEDILLNEKERAQEEDGVRLVERADEAEVGEINTEELANAEEAIEENAHNDDVVQQEERVTIETKQAEEVAETEERTAYKVTPAEPSEEARESNLGDSEETMSFSEWLKKMKKTSGGGYETLGKDLGEKNTPQASFENKVQLLDSFVDKLPTLKKKKIEAGPAKTPVEIGNLVNENETDLVTETLAKVYIQQKHYDKAKKAYQILKLKYPEKSSFFAAQISELKKLQRSK